MMGAIQENELLMLLFGLVVFVYVLVFNQKIKRIYGWKILLTSFYALLSGWTMTVLESLFWPNLLNFIEHISYLISVILLIIWCCNPKIGIKEIAKNE